ncbi:hypothetical protein [Lysobacter gummosus]|uniref:hypothetical protein n=1 Tax=Lysobacter gummosus TaxID=262324 RepID=UPI003636A236
MKPASAARPPASPSRPTAAIVTAITAAADPLIVAATKRRAPHWVRLFYFAMPLRSSLRITRARSSARSARGRQNRYVTATGTQATSKPFSRHGALA